MLALCALTPNAKGSQKFPRVNVHDQLGKCSYNWHRRRLTEHPSQGALQTTPPQHVGPSSSRLVISGLPWSEPNRRPRLQRSGISKVVFCPQGTLHVQGVWWAGSSRLWWMIHETFNQVFRRVIGIYCRSFLEHVHPKVRVLQRLIVHGNVRRSLRAEHRRVKDCTNSKKSCGHCNVSCSDK